MFRTSMLFAGLALACAGSPATATRLELGDALRAALRNNLQVALAGYDLAAARAEKERREGAFDWNLGARATASRLRGFSVEPQLLGPEWRQETRTSGRSFTGELGRTFTWGGSFVLSYAPAYASTTTWTTGGLDPQGAPLPPSVNPQPYTGSFSATCTQPLLRGAGRAVTMAGLVEAGLDLEAAGHRRHRDLIALVAETEGLYWDAVLAEKHLANKRTALDLARKLLQDNTLQVEVGTLAPIEVVAAEAQVAKAEQEILVLEAQVGNVKDALGRAIYPEGEAPVALELTGAPTLDCLRLPEEAAVAMALQRRVELKAARCQAGAAQVQARAAANLARPKLDAFVQYDGASRYHGSLGGVNGDLAGLRNPGYTLGLSFALPLGNREARGRLGGARARLRAQELRLKDQERSIALEVRRALRTLEAARKGVSATAKTRHFQEKSLEAERRKFQHGLSTSFTVLQAMTNLDEARTQEAQSQIAYAKAVTAMERALGNLLEARSLELPACP